ncbi:Imm39 family immunity protein [Pandoraea sp. PE-S2T-3]|uniref:Imm39 family immunity protein n=1 Tax=Pandoraea sp. PE-S2T-3 TaxID=1986993 RepID=UPI000B3F8DDB|nr:Imm39 family immunity protein [Pandoraea sp. PE-S2T-3]
MRTEKALLVGAVSLVKHRFRGEGQIVLAVRDEIDAAMKRNGFLINAPFTTVSLIIRYADKDDMRTEIGKVNRENGVIPIAVQVNVGCLSAMDAAELQNAFRKLLIEVLCDLAANFDLPYAFLDAMRAESPPT